MMRMKMVSLAAALALGQGVLAGAAVAAEEVEIPAQHWSWQGLFGGFDQTQLQRGYLVYEQVCATCHSMNLVAFRHLEALGFNEDQIKAIAANRTVRDLDSETGAPITRPALPADYFPSPYTNEIEAKYTHGVAPPDLSVITKAREFGADYVYALLTGYEDPPAAEAEDYVGKYYNPVFVNGPAISMAPPLADGLVTFADGTPNTAEQMARDVAAFLAWAGEPYLVERKELGVKVILFLIVLAGIAYAVKRKIWADVEH